MSTFADLDHWREIAEEALKQGHHARNIISMLSQMTKPVGAATREAQKQGYTEDQILNYITKGNHLSYGQKQTLLQGMSEGEAATRITQEREKPKFEAQPALGIAGTLLGAAAGTMALKHAAGSFLAPLVEKAIGMNPTQPAATTQPTAAPAPAAPSAPLSKEKIIQDAESMGKEQPKAVEAPIPSVAKSRSPILDVLGDKVKNQIVKMVQEGHNPEMIGTVMISRMTPEERKTFSTYAKQHNTSMQQEILNFVRDEHGFLRNDLFPLQEGKASPKLGADLERSKNIGLDTQNGASGIIHPAGPTKVMLQDDTGKHTVADQQNVVPIPPELQPENVDYRDMAERYKSTFPRTGPGSLSTNVASLAFHPGNKELFAGFVTSPGKLYHYRNVEPELYDRIKSQSVAPKTTGTGFLGEYDPAIADSIGSPMQEIIRNPEKYPFEIYDVGYNMLNKLLEAIAQLEKEHAKAKREQEKRKASKKST